MSHGPKLITKKMTVGEGIHRSGWPYAMSWLRRHHDREGILFDDFFDRTMDKPERVRPYDEPWVGILHHPPTPVLESYRRTHNDIRYLLSKRWSAQALNHCLGLIALSEHLARHIRSWIDIPVESIKHPTGDDGILWSPERWHKGAKMLLQVGFYFRNSLAIYHVSKPECCKQKARIILGQNGAWTARTDGYCRSKFKLREEFKKEKTFNLPVVSNDIYDTWLSQSVVLMELLDASANNAIIECIQRATPLVINRHPAAVEYLGGDYPLFYSHPSEVRDLVTDDSILAAHCYLKAMDKQQLSGDYFAQRVVSFVRKVSHGIN